MFVNDINKLIKIPEYYNVDIQIKNVCHDYKIKVVITLIYK